MENPIYLTENHSSPKSQSFVNYAQGGAVIAIACGWLALAVTLIKAMKNEKKALESKESKAA